MFTLLLDTDTDISDSFNVIPDILLSHPDYSQIKQVKPLLDRLQVLALSTTSIVPASENVTFFISRLEDADPNSSDISEDDHNAQWGHWQYGAASITITSVLVSWDAVGGVPTACRLLAAGIRTHRVAEAICFQRSVKEKPLLSLDYLSRLVDQLWNLVKDLSAGSEVCSFSLSCQPLCRR